MSITSRINEMSSHIEQAYDELQGLGADLTNVNKNIENISIVLDDIYDSMPQVSGEGTSLTLDDTRVGKIKSTLKGNTSQSGTPTPTSPIPVNVVSGDNEINVIGKNILDSKNLSSATYSGISFTPVYENGLLQYINVNGTATSDASYSSISSGKTPYANRTPITPNVTHYCSGCPSNGSTSTYFISYYYYNDTNTYLGGVTDTGNGATINNANAYYVASYITIKSGATMNNVKFYPMVSTLSDNVYDPYNADTYNVDLPVENLLPYPYPQTTKTTNGITFTDLGDGTIKVNGTATANASLTLFASYQSQGTIPGDYVSGGLSSNVRVRVINHSGDSYHVLGSSDGTSVAIDKSTYTQCYIELTVMSGATVNNLIVKPMITNIKANNYTPYGTTPIELCKIGTYQDYIYKDSGKWYLHKEIGKVVLNGSSNRFTQIFSTNTSGINRYRTNEIPVKLQTSGQIADVYCNKLLPKTLVNTYGRVQGISVSDAITMFIIYIDDIGTYTLEQANNWLSTNNLEIYYVLATPTTEELTYEPLINQLNLLEKAMSKDGQTNISQVNNDLPFIISASALKEWQESTSLNSTLSMVNPLSLGNTLNTQENDIQPTEVDNIEPLEEEENEES